MSQPLIHCEVAYALPARQLVVEVDLPPGATAVDALHASGLLERCPEIDAAKAVLGVFGRVVKREQVLRDGDRVEIYRPLQVDPKAARRARARKA